MRKIFKCLLFFLASKIGLAWSETTLEEKGETFKAFFRVAQDFVTNSAVSCPNKFDNFYQLFKNLHEQLVKVLDGSQEKLTASGVPPPPPPAPPPLNFSALKMNGTKDALYVEAKRFWDGGGLREQFGRYQAQVMTYEQFVEMKKCWQPEAQKTYDTLVVNCFCRFFDNCRLLLSAFLDELCSKFPREMRDLESGTKAVLKDLKIGQTEPKYWTKPLEAFDFLLEEEQLKSQLEAFLVQMFLYGFAFPNGRVLNLEKSLIFISNQSKTVADATKDLKDWPFGSNPKGAMNETIKMISVPEVERRWLELSEKVVAPSKGLKAEKNEVDQFLEGIPQYKEVAHEKLYRFLEAKYRNEKGWLEQEGDIALFEKVARWGNSLPEIPWDEVMVNAPLRENLEGQFNTKRAKDKFKSVRELVEANETYKEALETMRKIARDQLSRQGVITDRTDEKEFVKKIQEKLEKFAQKGEGSLEENIKSLVKSWRDEKYTNVQIVLKLLEKTGKGLLEKVEDVSLREFLTKIIEKLLPAEVAKFEAKNKDDKQSRDIATPPGYKEELLRAASAGLEEIHIPFKEDFSSIRHACSDVQIQEILPFLENAKKSLNRQMTLTRLFLGTPSPANRKTRKVVLSSPIRMQSLESTIEEELPGDPKCPEERELLADIDNLKTQLEALQKELEECEHQKKTLENEKIAAQTRLLEYEDRLQKLQNALQEEVGRRNQLDKEIKSLKRAKEEQESNVKSLNCGQELLKVAQEEANVLAVENNLLNADNKKLKHKNESLKKQLARKTNVRGGNSDFPIIRENTEAEQALRDELAQKEVSLGAKDRELQGKDEEILDLQNLVANLRQKLKEAEEKANLSKQPSSDAFGTETNDLEVQRQELEMVHQELIEQKEAQQKLQTEQEKRTRDLDAREKAVKAKEDRLATVSKKNRSGNATEKVLPNDIKIGETEKSDISGTSPKNVTPQTVRIPMALPANIKNANDNNMNVKTLPKIPTKGSPSTEVHSK